MGGIRNLPSTQTDQLDPQDNILIGNIVWLGLDHFLYDSFLGYHQQCDNIFSVLLGGKPVLTQGARALSTAPQASPTPIGL